jgi:hypothetical protein
MGAEPWDYFVPYEPNIQTALDKLRQREFAAGRFRGSELSPTTIEEAFENMDADGTASILDIERVSDEADYGAVCPVSSSELNRYFGTDKPTREMIEANVDLYEDIERGQGIYTVVYKDGKPSEIFFAGYSFD